MRNTENSPALTYSGLTEAYSIVGISFPNLEDKMKLNICFYKITITYVFSSI